ncbi:MAG: UBP-type zinc finger domain-containing protein [Nocardioidaceae bacterium]|nr:UBP-type zinc finger domain-containing protein [Nocardioidaceae bacterium]
MTQDTGAGRAGVVSPRPSGTGCGPCLGLDGGWWFHLRRCVACGEVGCCDSSPGQHASTHARQTGHHVIVSFEPGEDWSYDFDDDRVGAAIALPPPVSRPDEQGAPAPADRVPADWTARLH